MTPIDTNQLQSLGRVGGGWDFGVPVATDPEWRLQSLGRVGGGWDSASTASSSRKPCCNPSDGLGVVGTAQAIVQSLQPYVLQSLGRVGGGWDYQVWFRQWRLPRVAIPRTGWGWLGPLARTLPPGGVFGGVSPTDRCNQYTFSLDSAQIVHKSVFFLPPASNAPVPAHKWLGFGC